MESKDYSWKFVTADELLSHGACELVYAYLSADAVNADTILYDGENTTGKQIVNLENGDKHGAVFNPPRPVYCRRGLYIDIAATNVDGVFVMWRELG